MTLQNSNKWLIVALITVLIIGIYLWQRSPAQTVNIQSQQQAETTAGVKAAADNAHVKMLEGQLAEAAKQIAELKDREPEKIIITEVKEVIKVVERERAAVGADFAIVASPDKPTEAIDLKSLPENAPVNLNQYNVFAYKKLIRGFNLYPDWGEIAQGNFKLQEVGFDVSKKITRDGKYLGVAFGYDLKNEQAKMGLRYAF